MIIRLVNGDLGGAVAVRKAHENEHMIAVFADAGVDDFALVNADLCVLISGKRGIALLDLETRQIVKRGYLSFQPRGIVSASDGASAVVYGENHAFISLVSLPALQEIRKYNLAERRADGDYDLVYCSTEDLRKDGLSLQKVPFCDAPLRRLRFSKNVRPRLRADGRLIAPIEYCEKGPEFIWNQTTAKLLANTLFNWTIGIAELDLANARVAFRPFRHTTEQAQDSRFAIVSISPDASHAVLQSVSAVLNQPTRAKPAAGHWQRCLAAATSPA